MPDFFIVGIGASAGGLEAFFQFFDNMPASSGMAFIIVTHLNPHQQSSLVELLSTHTSMQVRSAEDGQAIERDNVYVIPPDALLSMQAGTLRLIKPTAERRMPIDHFFSSLAAEAAHHAIGVVLSGTGSDGTLGLRAIKENGGLTIAQTPENAKFDSMPQNAIATGFVDCVLEVDKIPAKLVEYSEFRSKIQKVKGPVGIRAELDENLAKIAEVLRKHAGHDFTHYKKGTLLRRIERRMLVRHVASVGEYLRQLEQFPQEVDALFDDLLIGVTSFFRDPEAFDALAANVVSKLLVNRAKDDPIRVWVPGCSTGEETYSLAILIHEQMAVKDASIRLNIFATDIERHAPDAARRGRYPEGITNQVSPHRLARYFEKTGSSYQVVKHIRDCCVFSSHDLIRDPPFSRLDLISCRNLLIYLEPELQKKIIPIFHYALRPGGCLFLGSSEDVHQDGLFIPLGDRKFRIFQRREPIGRSAADLPLQLGSTPARIAAYEPKTQSAYEPGLIRTLERIVLDQYTSGCAFIDEKGNIIFLAGETEKFLHRPAGPPSNNIIEIARKSIRLDLRAAIGEAIRTRNPVVRQNISVKTSEGVQCVNLIVRPVPEAGAGTALFLVRFQEAETPKNPGVGDVKPDGARRLDEQAVQQLENELQATREKLDSSVGDLEHANEDLRSSNEEVLSMNEELQSSNEELQTSKEELQSINEELETVNEELNQKVVALTKANNDSKNLFESTQLATVFLDKKMRIGKFTPAAKQLFNLIDTDVSRPITDFAPQFIGANLVSDAEHVLRSLAPIERPVQSNDRKLWYMMRVLPYRTLEDAIEGVVITFHDVTELRKAQQQRDAIIESSVDAIIAKTIDGVITTWNPAAQRLYGYSAEEAIGHSIGLIVPRDRIDEQNAVTEQIMNGHSVEPYDTLRSTKDGRVLDVRVSISPIYDEHGRIVGASSISTDISARKRAEQAARISSSLLRAVVETAPDGIITVDKHGVIQSSNLAMEHIFGYAHGEIVGATIAKLIPEPYRATLKVPDESTLLKVFRHEVAGLRKDGTVFPMDVSISETRTESGEILTAIVRDITERKLAEEALRSAHVLQESEARFRQLAELIPPIVWTNSPEGRIEFVNQKWLDYTGTKVDADHMKTWEHILHPDDAAHAVAQWHEALKTHQPYDCEHRLRRHDGVYRWHVSRSAPLFGEKGEIVRWFGTSTDFDDQKRAQEALKTADRQKDDFLAILGHELRNPLAPVRTAAHVLQSFMSDDPKLKRACEIIQRQSAHMTRIIDDLLDISRISRGKIVLRKEQIDLNDAVCRTVEDYRTEIETSGATLEIKTFSEPLWSTADPTRISQVVGNLLQNARKFTGDGGRITVEVLRCADPANAEVVVRDTGIGMSAELIDTVFEPFKQGHNSVAQRHGGLGIGLAMVKGIVELHGGSVRAFSKGPGQGSEFTLRLPLDREKKVVVNEKFPPPPGRTKSHRVLIIEDNIDSADAMCMLLESCGHVVTVAMTAVEGMDAAHEFRPEITLCDIGLPGEMDGYAVAKAFRADKTLRSSALIALTGYGQESDKQQALSAGFDFHLTKPVAPESIIELIRSLK